MFRGRWREEVKTIEESQNEKVIDKDEKAMKVSQSILENVK